MKRPVKLTQTKALFIEENSFVIFGKNKKEIFIVSEKECIKQTKKAEEEYIRRMYPSLAISKIITG